MTYLSRFLDTVGDGSGTKNMIGNYSAVEETTLIAPSNGEIFEIARLLVTIEDGAGFWAERYGAIAALTNGITAHKQNSSGIIDDYTDGFPVKNNAHWAAFCHDVELRTWGAGDELLTVRWTFSQGGEPIILDGTQGDQFEIHLNDDFSFLVGHYFMVQGLSG